MRQVFILSLVLVFFQSCNNTKHDYKEISQNIEMNHADSFHPGKKLMETNCYVCHNPTTEHDKRIAPPMIAVKKHYISNNTSKEDFIRDIQNWIKNPSEENARMYGAVRKFGVMPNTPYPEETIYQIADYIFDNDIEQPEWFEAHYNQEKGRGMGHGKGQGQGQRMLQGNNSDNPISPRFDKSGKSYSEIGMHYALSTKKELGRNLMGTIQKKGTLEALEFCNERAYTITDSMSVSLNAKIKRVSDKPRNPANQADILELEYIKTFKKNVKAGQEPNPIVMEHGENIKFYYPIVTNAMCLQCHGKLDSQITVETRKTIKALYPSDKAIGYDVNNVRGIWSISFNKDDE